MSEFPTYASAPQPPRRPAGPPVRTLLVVAIAVVLLVGVTATVTVLLAGRAAADEIVVEPAAAPGANPFLPPVAKVPVPVAAPPGTGGRFPGDTPGLYGGTRNDATCDAAAMVAFLQQNPAKAAAWASVLAITPADIPGYVAGLTPVVLRSDTLVTNHGFRDGRATTLRSVLQAGTAVFVDRYGVPRVRCYCGNPLTPAVLPAEPVFTGPPWPGFARTSITIIQQTTVVVDVFTLVDVGSGEVFTRTAGPDVSRDRPGTSDGSSGAVPTTPTTPTATVAPPGPLPSAPPRVLAASGSHVLTQSDGSGCSFSDAPRITGSFRLTVAPDGSLSGEMAGQGSGTRDLTCGDMGGRMSWSQRYAVTFTGRTDGGVVRAQGTLENVNSTTLSGCTNAGHPVDCPEYAGGPGAYPVTVTGSYDPATGRGRGEFVVGGVDRETTGTWTVTGQ
jgi:hypothetical protein